MTRPMPVYTETLISPEPWMREAACTDLPPDLWFPTPSDPHRHAKQAKTVCGRCPVAGECLDYALRRNESTGIWGGLTAQERARLRAGKGTA